MWNEGDIFPISEWLKLLDDGIITNSAMEPLTKLVYQIVIEVQIYRKKKGSNSGLYDTLISRF
jgi:hypothetical protein